MSSSKHYPEDQDASLQLFFALLDKKNQELNERKKTESDLWKTILFKLKVDWTYNSNSIEGSTFTRGDTVFFLSEGLTVKGKPLKDHLDTQNHAEAIDTLFDFIANRRELSEGFLKELNALLLHGVKSTPAMTPDGAQVEKKATPGQYKTQPNHVLQQDGSIHKYVEPLQVPGEMAALVEWVNENLSKLHPCYVAAVAHYNMVRIHPFDDGNGRGARILMNLILMKAGYFPAVIRAENRQDYIKALQAADKGDLTPFIEFVTKELIHTTEEVTNNMRALSSEK
jgi:Fic family protein